MIVFRAPLVAVVLACSTVATAAAPRAPIQVFDFALTKLCAQLAEPAEADVPAIRFYLARTWKERAAYLAALPARNRAAAQRTSTVGARCLALAKAAATSPAAAAEGPAAAASGPQITWGQRGAGYGGGSRGRPIGEDAAAAEAPEDAAGNTLAVDRLRPLAPSAAARVPASAECTSTGGVTTCAHPGGPDRAPPAGGRSSLAHEIRGPALPELELARGGGNHQTSHAAAPRDGHTADGAARPASPQPGPAAPAPATPSAGASASTQLPEFYPWPPPTPSGRRLLQVAQLAHGAAATNWGQLADQLTALLTQFSSWGFYSAPGGFALVTQIEHLNDQTGKALAGDARWVADTHVAGGGNLLSGIFALQRPKGLYRVFAFVLTTDPASGGPSTDPAALFQIARQWGMRSELDLPQEQRAKLLVPEQRLFTMVYEFESDVDGPTNVDVPGHFTLSWHLNDAGIVLPP